MERKRSLQDEEGPSTSTAEGAANRYIQEKSFGEMENMDDKPMEGEEFKNLHEAIEEGNLELVRQIMESHGQEHHFMYDDKSALFKAYQYKDYEIISFLIHKGAELFSSEDQRYFQIDLVRLNHLLYVYNRKSDKACVHKLMSLSQSPQVLNGERMKALLLMYEHFFKIEIIKILMIVLEKVDFVIVFDFDSDKINRVHRLGEVESETYGLTRSHDGEIFIGGKHLVPFDPKKTAKVYGVVAEELCHLALTTVFENDAKPYKEEDSKLIHEFHDIVRAVKSLSARSCHTESVIRDVFDYYYGNSWECELIARVPHVIGIYGEKLGREKFEESSELSRLLNFYDQNVHERCKVFCDPSLNTKSHREMERIIKKDEFISLLEKKIRPLEEFKSFREYLVEWESISVILTNCCKLCMLHVYHDLKKEYEHLVEKKCLFLTRKCLEENIYEIRDAIKGYSWEYLILLMDKRQLNLSRFQAENLDHLEEFTTNGMKLIMISSSQSTDQMFDFQKAVNYKWSDLSEEYKTNLQLIKYIFKGIEEETFVRKEDFPKVFDQDYINVIIGGELIEVNDGSELFCQGYVPETYIQREFHYTVADDKIFTNMPPDTNIFLSGFNPSEHKGLSFQEEKVQWLKGSHDNIQCDKSIFIVSKDAETSFEDFRKRCLKEKCIWLHYYKQELHVRNTDSCGDVFGHHIKQKTLSEEETLNFLKRERTVIISDNAGYGKSTVISSLIDNVKRIDFCSWNLRINFNKFSVNKSNPLSIANVQEKRNDEEVLNQLFLMLGLKNGLERHLFRKFSKEGHCFIFFDGFDEIPSDYKKSALKLLSTVRKQTAVNMIISTRKHHQKELEELLSTYSHQLVPLSREDQVKYLDKMWKDKLKYPNGRMASQNDRKKVPEKIRKIIKQAEDGRTNLDKELNDLITALNEIELRDSLESIRRKIDDLNFSKLAETVIEKTSLDKETVQFMGIPLHLFMIGSIYFDSNFKVEINSGIYSIYSKFIDVKIRIYVEEKQGILYDGSGKEIIIKTYKTNAYRIHIELANQLMDKGKIEIINMSEEDKELCAALGIAFIKGEQIDFLHHTFTEYYRAESIRKNLKKDVFIGVLFQDKYEVVKRFLLSALEEKSFENLTKEFFEDLEFLFSVLKRFVEECRLEFRYYASNLKLDTIARIVKCLMESLEYFVDLNCLNKFVLALRSKLSSFLNWCMIGGCLTVKMIKILFNGNYNVKLIHGFWFVKLIKVYSIRNDDLKLMFGVVAYYSNPEEIIELLSECISIENSGECDSNERENENRKAERLLKVLKYKDSNGFSLLSFAALNVRMETILKLLEFSRNSLGEELFVNEIIGNREYNWAMDVFIIDADFNRICGFLKTFHSVFGKQIDIFFHEKLKFLILKKTLEIELSNEFEVIINLFKEYFEMEKIKEVLFICDSNGNYLIHILVNRIKNVIKNLNIVRNILVESSEMKQFLMFKNRKSMNIFHFAAENENVNFGDLLEFCSNYLEKDEIKQMLTSCDENGLNVLHLLFQWNSTERIIECLDVIKNTLDNDESFKKLLKGEDKRKRNIFHFAARNKNVNFGEIMKFCSKYLGKDDIEEMLTFCDDIFGWNALHILFDANSTERIIECLDVIKNTLDNDESFKKLLKGETKNKRNIFHFAAGNINVNFGEIMKFCSKYLGKDEIEEMLTSCENVLHLLIFANNSTEGIIECLDVIKNTLDNKELFKNLLNGENKDKINIFHFAAGNRNVNFGDFLKFCSNYLEKHEIEEMLTSCDEDGSNVLHLLFGCISTERIIECLDVIKKTLDNDELFKQILKGENKYKRNIFHFAAENVNEIDISFLSSYLCENEIKELLIGKTVNGDTILHLAANFYSRNLLHLLEYLFERLKADEGRFEDLILAKNENGDTFLHWFVKKYYINFGEVLGIVLIKYLKENVSDNIFKKLLRIRNKRGETFLQVKNENSEEYSEIIIECCKTILEESLFEEL